MERASTNASSRGIVTLFQFGSLCGLSDRQLLDLFVAKDGEGDGAVAEAAFEALVKRHGPMVRRLCRSLMNHRDDADDAFQATFLVLARRAGTIRDCEAVASWLYGVAGRVVARARSEAKRRLLLERVVAEHSRREGAQENEGPGELMPELYEEVARLPEHYRAPIVLCYLEGQTHEQAARTLGCPLRTLQTRLQRGKAKLRLRLVERGLAPEAGLLAVATAEGLFPSSTSATAVRAPSGMLPAGLSESTARVSVHFATARTAGRASAALGLARAVLKSLFWNRLRRTAGLVSGFAMGLTLTYFGLAAAVQETGKPASPAVQETGKPADTVAIRVHDDRGRPISGAVAWMQTSLEESDGTLGHGTTDAQGRALMPVPALWRQHPEDKFGLIWAHAQGHHMATANAWKALVGKAESVELTLGPSADTAFLVLDPEGHAVAGATVEPRVETDRQGAFALKAMPSGVPLSYSYFFAVALRPGLDREGEAQIVQENPLLLRAVGPKRP
jgi:RNA polymerase sigma factor (sigma-70 family)